MSFELTVRASPGKNNEFVHTNLAYVSPALYATFKSKPAYLKADSPGNDVVFTAAPNPEIPNGEIGVNKIQRFASKLANKAYIFKIFHAPQTNFGIANISLEFSFVKESLGATMNGGHMDAQEFIKMLHENYDTQILSQGQKFICSNFGVLLYAEVKEIEIYETKSLTSNHKMDDNDEEDDGKIVKVAQTGMILSSTKFSLKKEKNSAVVFDNVTTDITGTGGQRKDLFKEDFSFEKLGIGGLDKQLSTIFRRAFVSRIFPTDVVNHLGVKHIKGILLYGPPGCGKTLIARQIGNLLNCRPPKIVNGPEVLNKYVGASEENVRKLFADAEAEWAEKGEESDIHLIIFDEIDAICKQRGTVSSGTGVNDSVVNQLLSKIDGVDSPNNFLIIGMTNRMDMMDEALLRPGRFEAQVEIGLPSEKGRLQIFKIHTAKMLKYGYLGADVDITELAKLTKNYSGAEIEGVVKSATSHALNEHVDLKGKIMESDEDEDDGPKKKKEKEDKEKAKKTEKKAQDKSIKAADKIVVSMADFMHALEEVRPAFGVQQDEIEPFLARPVYEFSSYAEIKIKLMSFIDLLKKSSRTNLFSVLLDGPSGSGKTTLAIRMANESGAPYVKILSPESMAGMSESSKTFKMMQTFSNAYKSELSCIVIDSIEKIIEYINFGPRFSNTVLQTGIVLLKKPPPMGRKMFLIATTAMGDVLREMGVVQLFNAVIKVKNLSASEVGEVLAMSKAISDPDHLKEVKEKAADNPLTIQLLLDAVEQAQVSTSDLREQENRSDITCDELYQAVSDLQN